MSDRGAGARPAAFHSDNSRVWVPDESAREANEAFDEAIRVIASTEVVAWRTPAASPAGPAITYEDVDTSLIPPRPRTYGLKGAEIIEKTWKEMTKATPTRKPQVASIGG